MELKASTQEPAPSPSISETNPNEKEISDDDDDDRNHKHRRRDDARSQSQERDSIEQVFTNKPFRRSNKQSENGHFYKEPGSHSNDTWKNYNFNPTDKRRQGPSDLNQKFRGRGNWNQHDPRFNSVDIASRIVPQGPVPPLFAGRGLPNVSTAYGPSWSAFGLVPGIPNGGLDTLYRSMNPSMNMGLGLPRQRCRDFEEQGFCLRGDMCPMEHGVNRIVVEDVQSLSQFNLPVSLQNANLPGAPSGQGPPPAPTKSSRGKSSKRGVGGNEHNLNDDNNNIGADFYDPDQPLWGNDSQTLQINQSNVKENGPLMDPGPSEEHTGPKITTKNKETKENPSIFERIEKPDVSNNTQFLPHKRNDLNGKIIRKATQQAQRTIFVSGIPHQQNKSETLFSHFHKFGEVIDIHIPLNTERAFVQFSKKEEAEAALKAPDAVMGNRFIKLFWANRDNVPIHGYPVPIPPRVPLNGTSTNSVPVPVPPKPVVVNSPKAAPPSQKKLETLEVLKEELRKKQEMLDRKRNDFRRKLDKLAKQATGVKGEIEHEQVAKRQKLGTVTSSSIDSETVQGNGNKLMETVVSQSSKSSVVQEPPLLKPSLRPLIPIGQSVVTNRFKLDNRPTAFKVVSILPNDLANVTVLKEHFSAFGDLSKVELDDVAPSDGNNDDGINKYTARVYFTTRHSAEKAFTSGKSLNGHNMQFSWIKSSNNQSPSKGNSDASVSVEISKTDSQKPGNVESEKMEIDKEEDKEADESNKE